MQAIILAGGKGTRLQSVIKDVPKPMADVNGKPFLKYLIQYLQVHKVSQLILSIGYKKESISNYFGDSYQGIPIKYVSEDVPLDTGGAIKKCLELIDDVALILNGDSFFQIDLENFFQFHKNTKAELSIALKPMKNYDRYGSVIVQSDLVVGFEEKMYKQSGLINGGVYLVQKSIFQRFDLPEKFSFERDFLQKYLSEILVSGYIEDNYFIDIGIPEDYFQFCTKNNHAM